MEKIDYEKIFGKDRLSAGAIDIWPEAQFRKCEEFTENKMRETVKEIAKKFEWTISNRECENVADRLTDLLLNDKFFEQMLFWSDDEGRK